MAQADSWELPPTMPGTHCVRSAGSMALPHRGMMVLPGSGACQGFHQPQQIAFQRR